MKTIRVVTLKEFTIGLVLALAEQEFLVIDTPKVSLHAAIESAYEAIREDVERENDKSKFSASLYEIAGDVFGPVEIIDYALGARLMTCAPQAQRLEVIQNERFRQAYYELKPTCRCLYKKAAQAFINRIE